MLLAAGRPIGQTNWAPIATKLPTPSLESCCRRSATKDLEFVARFQPVEQHQTRASKHSLNNLPVALDKKSQQVQDWLIVVPSSEAPKSVKMRSLLLVALVSSVALWSATFEQAHGGVLPSMQLIKLTSATNSATCNDGSQIGYYARLNSSSRSWVVYLQGGGVCGGAESCKQRWQQTPNLMSSNNWPLTKSVGGILSRDPSHNPHLWSANHIYVPYCSSDSWTGFRSANDEQPFAFMGSKIIERVFDSLYDDLPRDSSLHEAKFVLLAGDSAGATGVILNLDKVNDIVRRRASACIVAETCSQQGPPLLRGIADSGWFLDNEPYLIASSDSMDSVHVESPVDRPTDCDSHRCSPVQYIGQSMRYWNGQVPSECALQYPRENWRCYFGYRAYQTLKTPLFVVQWLYDEAQLIVDNIGRPDTSNQWNYVNKVVKEMRTSLENVTALFAPSCFSHGLITKKSWNQININGNKLPNVLNTWEIQEPAVTPFALETLPTFIESEYVSPLASTNQNKHPIRRSSNSTARSKHRKRRRNNQAQKLKSQVPKSTEATPSVDKSSWSASGLAYPRLETSSFSSVSDDTTRAMTRSIIASSQGRSSRSTSVDEPVWLLNNYVPDENSPGTANQQNLDRPREQRWTSTTDDTPNNARHQRQERFRFIDTCTWPHCNRDCAIIESDFGFVSQL